MPIYKITFKDSSVYFGGETVFDSKWDNIPDKEILCLEYFINEHSSLTLRDFESYNHVIEATKAVYGPKGTDMSTKLHNIYLMGKNGDKVTSFRIALVGASGSDKYHKGDITKREVKFGKEFRGKPTTNWRKGVIL